MVLTVQDLTVALPKGADRPNAVEAVSLTVNKGEIVCIVGESGSGKSVIAQTIMSLLPGGLDVVAGAIHLEGESLLSAPERRIRQLRGSRMAMIFQEPMTALNPVMKVGSQIAEVLRIHTALSADERRVRALDIMRSVHLPNVEALYDRYPHQLSGGQRQRVMIASALLLEPALVIADEPTTALDVTTQANILRLIKEGQKARGTAVLFITHDIGVVADIADRVIVMQRGHIVETGPVREVLWNPQHPYTRMLLAAVPSMRPRLPKAMRQSTHPVLEVSGLCKSYGHAGFFRRDRPALAIDEVSIRIQRGETLGIVGESGSGKSTLARCVMRLVAPSSGAVRLDDVDFSQVRGEPLRRLRRRVQIVFQDPYRSLNPRRSVGQSIVECPMNFGLEAERAWERAAELMQLVGLDAAALHRLPHEFSGGQRQRICIARALAVKPELLVADEAVSALDVSVQAQVLALLDDIRQKLNLAMLFITHDLRVAAQICDNVAVMHQGKIVEAGSAYEIFSNPRHEYTIKLLEAAPGRAWQEDRAASALD